MRLRYFVGLALIGLGIWMGLYPTDWMGWFGFSKIAYFQGPSHPTDFMAYALFSGVLPCAETAIGLGTIISGLFHTLNCHVSGCPRINRHKVAGGEYGVCSRHWREINHLPRDHKFTIDHLREHHHRHLAATGRHPEKAPAE